MLLSLLLSLAPGAAADPLPGEWPPPPLVSATPEVPSTITEGSCPQELHLQADLDEDGEPEQIVVSWTTEVEVVVTITEPGVEGPQATQTLMLGQAFDIEGPLRSVSVRTTRAVETAIPLLYVNWAGQEMCGSGDWTRYASYRSPGPGQPGQLREALSHSGTGGDAPVYWETTATFLVSERAATVRKLSGEYGDNGAADFINDDRTTRYELKEGVYEEVSVVVAVEDGKPVR